MFAITPPESRAVPYAAYFSSNNHKLWHERETMQPAASARIALSSLELSPSH